MSAYNFSAQLWMTTEEINSGSLESLPDLETIMPLLDLLGFGSNSHMNQLKEVMGAKLPEGFPVKIGGYLSTIVYLNFFSSCAASRAPDPFCSQGHRYFPQFQYQPPDSCQHV
jgi:hypothetical protein